MHNERAMDMSIYAQNTIFTCNKTYPIWGSLRVMNSFVIVCPCVHPSIGWPGLISSWIESCGLLLGFRPLDYLPMDRRMGQVAMLWLGCCKWIEMGRNETCYVYHKRAHMRLTSGDPLNFRPQTEAANPVVLSVRAESGRNRSRWTVDPHLSRHHFEKVILLIDSSIMRVHSGVLYFHVISYSFSSCNTSNPIITMKPTWMTILYW